MKTNDIIIKVLAAALALTAFTSCQEKLRFSFTKGEAVKFSVGTAGSGTDTKAAYSGDETETLERIDWEPGDLIRIYCGAVSEPETFFADYRVTDDITPSGALSKAHIECAGGIGLRWGEESVAHTFYAVYPSPEEDGSVTTGIGISPYANGGTKSTVSKSISGATVTAKLPATQKVVGSITTSKDNATLQVAAPDLKNMLMTAKSKTYTEASGITDEVFLSFIPLTTAVQFTITNQTKASLTIKSVSLTSASKALNGPFTVNIDNTSQPYGTRDYPECTYTGSVSDATKTVTINFASAITLAYDAVPENSGKLTFTFFLQPCNDFSDLTFKLVKDGGEWMSTKLGYTDGSGVWFPRFKKTTVKGILVPEGAQWTVKYAPGVDPWNPGGGDIDPIPEVSGDPIVTSWNTGIDKGLELKPKNSDLLPGKFSVSPTVYVQFSRGNLLATRSSSSSDDWKLGFFENQYDYGTYSTGSVFTTNDTEMSLFTFGFDTKATSFNPIGQTIGSEDWGNEYNRQYSLPSGTWQTLTGGNNGEWWYLLDGRPNAANLKVFKTVHGISNCLIIFPDNFNTSVIPSSTSLTDDQWSDLEAKGAVCLPQAGIRTALTYATSSNGYWANNSYGASLAYGAFFTGPTTVKSEGGGSSNYGYSVRLVQKFDWPEVEPTFVDLGLPSGTLWADVNVGAVSKTGVGSYGKYYAWGETAAYLEPMTGYGSWAGAKNANYVEGVIKQHVNNNYWKWLFPSGSTAKYKSKDLMLPEDDIATLKYGDGCHIPTMDQWYELFNAEYCTWTWDATKNGHIVTNVKYLGRSIFIPPAGYYYDKYGNLAYDGTTARFWSSDYWNSKTQNCVYINTDGSKSGSGLSDYGNVLTVRAVKQPDYIESHDGKETQGATITWTPAVSQNAVRVEMQVSHTGTSSVNEIVCTVNGQNDIGFWVGYRQSSPQGWGGSYLASSITDPRVNLLVNFTKNQKYSLKVTKLDGTVTDVVVTEETAVMDQDINFIDFFGSGSETGSNKYYGGNFRLFYAKIYDGSGTLIGDLVPTKNGSNYGLYDKVQNKSFFGTVHSGGSIDGFVK